MTDPRDEGGPPCCQWCGTHEYGGPGNLSKHETHCPHRPRGSSVTDPRQSPLAYHVTTKAKLLKYAQSGRIIEPVRFWPDRESAVRWARRTCRPLLVTFPVPDESYPLPDHRPARWTPRDITEWEVECLVK